MFAVHWPQLGLPGLPCRLRCRDRDLLRPSTHAGDARRQERSSGAALSKHVALESGALQTYRVLFEPGHEAVRVHSRRRVSIALGEFRYLSKQSGASGLSGSQNRATTTLLCRHAHGYPGLSFLSISGFQVVQSMQPGCCFHVLTLARTA